MTFAIVQDPILTITKQLYALLNAGVPLYRSVQILRQQAMDIGSQRMLDAVLHDLAEGMSFSSSLQKYPHHFSQFYINMIVVGEGRGELPSALQRIVIFFEKSREFRGKLINALTYPLILLCVGLGVSLTMLFGVLPRFVAIFSAAQVTLPLPTRILLGIQSVCLAYGWYILIGITLAIFGAIALWVNPRGRRSYDRFLLALPIAGHIATVIYVVRFCRTLGTLYNSGMQLLPALEISVASVGNAVFQDELAKTINSVRDGKGIAPPLSKSKRIPPMVFNMIAVGEETGDLERVLLDIAEYYDHELDYLLRHLMAFVEPLALVLISGLVMFIASSVMMPLFSMGSTLRAF